MGSPARGLARSIGKGVCLRCGALEDIASSGRPRHILSVARSTKQLRNQLLCFDGTAYRQLQFCKVQRRIEFE